MSNSDFWREKAQSYERYLIALLLSNQNRSFRISHPNLLVDIHNYELKLNRNLPSGDEIIYVVKKS